MVLVHTGLEPRVPQPVTNCFTKISYQETKTIQALKAASLDTPKGNFWTSEIPDTAWPPPSTTAGAIGMLTEQILFFSKHTDNTSHWVVGMGPV